ncbi:MAG: IS701 family transposase [Peptococcaceae bacterium]|nr:IS701 family transposase [Peptococcaceae bacterium]
MATYRLMTTPLEGELSDFETVRLIKVDETKWESSWDKLVNKYHYLGYDWQFGGRIKYLITIGERIVGAIGFCSGVYKLGPRDKYIGLSDETRASLLPHIVNQNRFLILPFVKIRNLASHVLSISLKQLIVDWTKQYEVEPYLVETFVDRQRYNGTSYQAANWICLGKTQGYGKQGDSFVYHGTPKDIYVKVVNRRFAGKIRPDAQRLNPEREELIAMINGVPMWMPSLLKHMGIPEVVARGTEGLGEALADHLLRYLPFLGRKEHRQHLLTQVKGRLSDLDRKSNEPVALAFTGADGVRNLANFMKNDRWDDQGMLAEYRIEMGERLFEPEGMITGDGCDFPKKGKNSVGVKRQFCGRLGKTDSCQASVMVGYAGAKGYGLLDYELYMPEEWFDESHDKLRKQNLVPEDLEFKTKTQMLAEMIQNIASSEQFQGKYVGVDSSFGTNKEFLDALPESLIYFADIHNNTVIFRERPNLVLPPYKGRGRKPTKPKPEFAPVSVKSIGEDKEVPWNDTVLGIGAKGPIIVRDKLLRVIEARDGCPGKDVWLYMRQSEDNGVRYALCNAPADSPAHAIRKLAMMRWSIEQCFLECKTYLGMDHYEVRSWPGWHRHILITLIAHLFVIKLRQEFSVTPHSPGSTPFTEQPVSLDEYLEAYSKLENDQPIDHPAIKLFPDKPQQIMTIGLILALISPFLVKVGSILEWVDYQLKNQADAYTSHSKATMRSICQSQYCTGHSTG